MSQAVTQVFPVWKRILFSDTMLQKSKSRRIAYLGVLTALSIVANMFFEVKFLDVQFSITIFVSMISGILIGPLFGFLTAFLGDTIGYMYNSWGLVYMPWVALSCATTALIAGLIMNGIQFRFKGGVYIKLAIICVLSLLICTIGINTTGLYFYWTNVGFSQKALDYFAETLGTGSTYWAYCMYRMFFSGQIYNCLFNYVLLFLAVPTLCAIKPLKLSIV